MDSAPAATAADTPARDSTLAPRWIGDAVGGDRRQAARGLQLPFAIPLGAGPGAIDAQGVVIRIDDHLSPRSVDDQERAGFDPARHLTDTDDVGQTEGSRDDRGV